MIVQPDFPEHWKTRLLVTITGDESAPLAAIRLWAHCQHSRRSHFPGMTPAQLASICKWGPRKPACHVALVKAGFLEKLPGGGFAAHQWDDHNRQLLQKWEAGQKGGRPPTSGNANENPPNPKPTDNRPTTGTKPDRPDQTRPEEIDKRRPDRPDAPVVSATSNPVVQPASSLSGGMDVSKADAVRTDLGGLVGEIADTLRAKAFKEPTKQDVTAFLLCQFKGAEKYAEPFLKAMKKNRWKHRDGRPVQDWRNVAKEYASAAERNKRGVGTP